MAERIAAPGANDQRSRLAEQELFRGNGKSSLDTAAEAAMEEGKISNYVYVHEKETHKEPDVANYRKVAAEVISTFVLVFLGCGSVILDTTSGGKVTILGISFAFGLAIMAMVRAVGHISGAHMNPAITIAFASIGDFPLTLVPFYIVGQVGGAIGAAYVLRLMFDHDLKQNTGHLGVASPAHSALQSLAMEFILTMILMFVVCSVAVDSKSVGELAGLILGLTITLNAIVGIPVSGGSMNPARSIGPAVASHFYRKIWVYMVAPIPGAVVGAWLYVLVHGPQHLRSESRVQVRPHGDSRRIFKRFCKRKPVSAANESTAL